jgi:hypothetical protein
LPLVVIVPELLVVPVLEVVPVLTEPTAEEVPVPQSVLHSV